jgi:hypothetical protein
MNIMSQCRSLLFATMSLLIFANDARADECSDTYAGARHGPDPDWISNPYGDVCYVVFPGGGGATRDHYQEICENIPNFVYFKGDFGSNKNTCIFRPQTSVKQQTPQTSVEQQTPEDSLSACRAAIAAAGAIYDDENSFSGSKWAKTQNYKQYLTKLLEEYQGIEAMCRSNVYAGSARSNIIRVQQKLNSLTRPYNKQDSTGADKAKPWFTLEICNNSGDGEMSIALDVANHNNDRIKTVRGWWELGDGGCRPILERDFGDWTSMEIFVHAATENIQWPNRQNTWTQKCIADYSPYQHSDLQNNTCRPEENLLPFARYVVNQDDPQHTVYRINFTNSHLEK